MVGSGFWVALIGSGWGLWPGLARADDPARHQKALIIAVQTHQDPRLNLNFALQDSNALKKTLLDRAGVPPVNITVMNDESSDDLRPTLVNMRNELTRFLSDAKPDDRLILFFSGHGFIQDGQTYLVPSDFKRNAPKQTGLPAAEFREALSRCAAGVKFLILDCCQAGGEKGLDDTGPPSEAVAKGLDLEKVSGCIVLASCQAREKSYEWPEHQCSVFTYWLCRGLEGGADEDADGRLTADEVYKYSYDRVVKTVSQALGGGRTQTPVRNIGLNVAGPQEVLSLRPESPESLCTRLAAHLDLEARLRKLKKIGVLEFLEPYGKVEGLARSNLPAFCSERVRAELARLAGKSYVVLDSEQLRQATQGMKVADLGDPEAMRGLSAQGTGLDSVVSGVLRRRGRTLNLQCDLVSTVDGESLVRPGGVLPITESILGDDGHSFDNRNRPNGAAGSEKVVNNVIFESRKPNPLLEKTFPYSVEVHTVQAVPGQTITATTPRVLKPFGQLSTSDAMSGKGELIVGARAGEVFEVWIKNKSEKPVGLVLLLDGYNSREHKIERIEDAQFWVIQPGAQNAIGDWYYAEAGGGSGMLRNRTSKFVFAEVADSALGRQRFGEAIGTITAAFFEVKQSRGLKVGQGQGGESTLKLANYERGRLLGVTTIRYVSEGLFRENRRVSR